MMRLILIILAFSLAVVPTPAAWVESLYSRQAYLFAQNILTPISSLTVIAWFDLFLLTVFVGCPIWWTLTWRRFGLGRRRHAAGQIALDTATNLAAGATR